MKKLFKVLSGAVIAMSSFALAGIPALAQTNDDPVLYEDYTTSGYDYTTSSSSNDAAAGAFFGFSMLLWVVICCVGLVVAGVMAYVVYNDAKKNNVENGTLWAVLTFFFGLIPLLIYFLAIKKNATGGSAAK